MVYILSKLQKKHTDESVFSEKGTGYSKSPITSTTFKYPKVVCNRPITFAISFAEKKKNIFNNVKDFVSCIFRQFHLEIKAYS